MISKVFFSFIDHVLEGNKKELKLDWNFTCE